MPFERMTRRRSALILPLLFVLLAALAAFGADHGGGAEEIATRFLDESATAWNAGDLEAFCAFYAEDAFFVSPKGTRQGRAEVLASYLKSYPDRAAMGRLSFELHEVRASSSLRRRGALLTIAARWRLDFEGKDSATGHTLIVLRRTSAGWRVVQDASM